MSVSLSTQAQNNAHLHSHVPKGQRSAFGSQTGSANAATAGASLFSTLDPDATVPRPPVPITGSVSSVLSGLQSVLSQLQTGNAATDAVSMSPAGASTSTVTSTDTVTSTTTASELKQLENLLMSLASNSTHADTIASMGASGSTASGTTSTDTLEQLLTNVAPTAA